MINVTLYDFVWFSINQQTLFLDYLNNSIKVGKRSDNSYYCIDDNVEFFQSAKHLYAITNNKIGVIA